VYARQLDPQRATWRTAAQARRGAALADLQPPAEHPALEPAGRADADLELAEHALPDPRR